MTTILQRSSAQGIKNVEKKFQEYENKFVSLPKRGEVGKRGIKFSFVSCLSLKEQNNERSWYASFQ